jgi:alpha-ketoglutarate-dependent taurine dioxygenase
VVTSEAVIATKKLTETVGAEVLDVGLDRLLHDDALPDACMEALEEHGVLVFPELVHDDATQVAFARRLGDLVTVPSHAIPEITVISMDADNPLAEYFRGAFEWHLDGALDEIPCKAGMLRAQVIAAGDGGTEFASTYAAYDDLPTTEKERFDALRVVHTFEASQRRVYPDPTPGQLAAWTSRPRREHPLVWRHRSGRRSLVLGATTDHVVDMDPAEGRALLADLLERATRPERVLRHDWTVGDVVIWDNRGVIHRSCPYESSSPRELHRATLAGDEPIQ